MNTTPKYSPSTLSNDDTITPGRPNRLVPDYNYVSFKESDTDKERAQKMAERLDKPDTPLDTVKELFGKVQRDLILPTYESLYRAVNSKVSRRKFLKITQNIKPEGMQDFELISKAQLTLYEESTRGTFSSAKYVHSEWVGNTTLISFVRERVFENKRLAKMIQLALVLSSQDNSQHKFKTIEADTEEKAKVERLISLIGGTIDKDSISENMSVLEEYIRKNYAAGIEMKRPGNYYRSNRQYIDPALRLTVADYMLCKILYNALNKIQQILERK